MKKDKKECENPPVITGHDDRGEERELNENPHSTDSTAPDGISGYWS